MNPEQRKRKNAIIGQQIVNRQQAPHKLPARQIQAVGQRLSIISSLTPKTKQ